MLIDTAVGLVHAANLEKRVETCDTEAGVLTTTTHLLLTGEVVKIDQHLDITQAALEAAGLGQL